MKQYIIAHVYEGPYDGGSPTPNNGSWTEGVSAILGPGAERANSWLAWMRRNYEGVYKNVIHFVVMYQKGDGNTFNRIYVTPGRENYVPVQTDVETWLQSGTLPHTP